MTTRLLCNPAFPVGALAVETAEKIAEARAALDRLAKIANRAYFGDDAAAIEAEFGLAPGKGADFWYLLNQAATQFEAANLLIEFAERVDQGG